VARSTELGVGQPAGGRCRCCPGWGVWRPTGSARSSQDTFQAMAHPGTWAAMGLLGRGLETAAMAALPILLVGGGWRSSRRRTGRPALHPEGSAVPVLAHLTQGGLSRLFSGQGLWTLGKTLLKMAVLAIVGYLILHQLMHSVLGDSTLPLPVTLSAAASTVVDLMRFIGVLALVVAGRRLLLSAPHLPAEAADDQAGGEGRTSPERRLPRGPARHAEQGPAVHPHAHDGGRGQCRRGGDEPDPLRRGHRLRPQERPCPPGGGQGRRLHRRPDQRARPQLRGGDCGESTLARSLHASCEVDDIVPPRLYAAVARLLAFVYSLSPTARAFRDVHTMAS
jgi:hypothetical protein